jgi:hypothetical protein
MKELSSNADLHRFLLELEQALRQQGSDDLADLVKTASRHAAGMSTEFLGESRIALKEVLRRGVGVLSQQDQINVADVLKQLDDALDRRR